MSNRFLFNVSLILISACAVTRCIAQVPGTFSAAINYSAGAPSVPSNTGYLFGGIGAFDPHVGDFNGDGKPDIVVGANCQAPYLPNCPSDNGSAIAVYLAKGDGSFQPPILTSGGYVYLRAIAVGDFNRDGILDVAAATDCNLQENCSSGTLEIYLGKGDGTFVGGGTFALNGTVGTSGTLAVGDFNGDNNLDIAVGAGCYGNGTSCQSALEVFLGNGTGGFTGPNVITTSLGNPVYPVVGDFNGDGKLDIVAATTAATLAVFIGHGDGTFTQTIVPLPTSVYAYGIAAADLNSDGKLDLALASDSQIYVLLGNGDGTFQSPVGYYFSGYGQSVVAADMNGDGKPDLVVGAANGNPNAAMLLLNDGHGDFGAATQFSLGGWDSMAMVVGDFNGDGKADMVGVSGCPQVPTLYDNCPDSTISVLLGNGDGTMRSASYLSVSSGSPSVAVSDFNGDGFQDLAYSCGYPCQNGGFILLLSDGAGGYQAPLTFPDPSSNPTALTVADFNGDGRPDVVVSDGVSDGSVGIFLNTGNGTFSGPASFPLGLTTASSLVVGDFNGDGKPDLAALDEAGSVAVLLGNGDGTFGSPIVTALPYGGYELASFYFSGSPYASLAVVAHDPSDPIYTALGAEVLTGKGDGTFSVGGVSPAVGYDASGAGIAVADVNRDGFPDLVIGAFCDDPTTDASCTRGEISVLLGLQDGSFAPPRTTVVQDGNLWGVTVADLNGDGNPDIAAPTLTGVLVAFGNGDGTFQAPTSYAGLSNLGGFQLAVADSTETAAWTSFNPEIISRWPFSTIWALQIPGAL